MDPPESRYALIGGRRVLKKKAMLDGLARQCTKEAEDYLIDQYHREKSRKKILRILRALRVLGTSAARDAVVESIDRFIDEPELLPAVLGCLQSLPVQHNGERFLRFLSPEWPRKVRLRAIRILANCDSQYVRDRLIDKIIEPYSTIRVEGLRASGPSWLPQRTTRD